MSLTELTNKVVGHQHNSFMPDNMKITCFRSGLSYVELKNVELKVFNYSHITYNVNSGQLLKVLFLIFLISKMGIKIVPTFIKLLHEQLFNYTFIYCLAQCSVAFPLAPFHFLKKFKQLKMLNFEHIHKSDSRKEKLCGSLNHSI